MAVSRSLVVLPDLAVDRWLANAQDVVLGSVLAKAFARNLGV